MTKFNPNCGRTQKLKFRQFKNLIRTKLKNSNYERKKKVKLNCNKIQNSICDINQKAIKLDLNNNKTKKKTHIAINSKTQILQLKNSNSDNSILGET